MIKVNLIREARPGTRETAAAPRTVSAAPGAPANVNAILIVGLLILGMATSGAYWYVRHHALQEKQDLVVERRAEAQQLESIIAEVEQFQKRKDTLEKRIALINELKQNQKNPVRIMDKISELLPDLVWLTSMNVSGTHVSVSGKALNPNAFAVYLENIKNDPMFDEPVVEGITRGIDSGTVVYIWSMNFNFKYATEQAQSQQAGTAPGTASSGASPKPSPSAGG